MADNANNKSNYDNLFELIQGLSESVTNLNSRFDDLSKQTIQQPAEPVIEKSPDEAFMDWLMNT